MNLRIKQLLVTKGVRYPFSWLRKQGIAHVMAHRLLDNKTKRISIAHIGAICKAINCTPNDIFEWEVGEKENPLPEHHHLNTIAPRTPSGILQKLKDMTEAEILAWERRLEGGGLEGE